MHLPFDEFVPLFRAKKVKDASLNPSTVTSIQVGFSLASVASVLIAQHVLTAPHTGTCSRSMLQGKRGVC